MSKKILIFLISASVLSTCHKKEARPTPGGVVRIAWTGGLVGADPVKDWGCAGAIKIIRLLYSPLY